LDDKLVEEEPIRNGRDTVEPGQEGKREPPTEGPAPGDPAGRDKAVPLPMPIIKPESQAELWPGTSTW